MFYGRFEVVDRVADVVDPLAVLLDVLRVAAIGVERLHQLVLNPPHVENGGPLAGDVGGLEDRFKPLTEDCLVAREGGISVGNGNGDVFDTENHEYAPLTYKAQLEGRGAK